MKSKNKIILSLVISFSLAATYNACSDHVGFGPAVNQETVGGNPMTAVSVAAYQQPSGGTSLNLLSVCMTQMTLVPSNNALPNQTVSFTALQQQIIPQTGLSLGNLPIPAGNYSQVTVALSNLCGTGQSLLITNGNGTYSTSQNVNLQFNGNVTIGSHSPQMIFLVQPIVNNLGAANSNANLVTAATASSGTCLSTLPKRVFITSTGYTGSLGGLTGADTLCQTRATAANLSGSWKAWLSDSTTNAISRINDVSPWYLVDMTTLIFPTFASITATGPAVPLNTTEFGITSVTDAAWTNTGANGMSLGGVNDCSDWTSTGGSGVYGNSTVTGAAWTDDTVFGPGLCGQINAMKALYCFEQ